MPKYQTPKRVQRSLQRENIIYELNLRNVCLEEGHVSKTWTIFLCWSGKCLHGSDTGPGPQDQEVRGSEVTRRDINPHRVSMLCGVNTNIISGYFWAFGQRGFILHLFGFPDSSSDDIRKYTFTPFSKVFVWDIKCDGEELFWFCLFFDSDRSENKQETSFSFLWKAFSSF